MKATKLHSADKFAVALRNHGDCAKNANAEESDDETLETFIQYNLPV